MTRTVLNTVELRVDSVLSGFKERLGDFEPVREGGVVVQGVGLTVEVRGLDLGIGELCVLEGDRKIPAEVIGFREGRSLLMPLGDLRGVRPGTRVTRRESRPVVRISDRFLGRVIDPMGRALDGGADPAGERSMPLYGEAINPMVRRRIEYPLDVGIRSINAFLTIGQGQKIGVFAGAGVGKSTLLGMLSNDARVDVTVIGLIGERGREVREFIERDLGPSGLLKAVLVVSTGDQSPLLRIRGAYMAMSIAEYFRDQGKSVLFVMDSLTRFAMALREVGLAAGEPPTTRGYTPSVFAALPRFLERSGYAGGEGSITGIYTVLMEGGDLPSDPLSEALAAILDGHIFLSRDLASEGIYPAVDPLESRSRVMNDIIDEDHRAMVREFLRLYALYRKSEDLIRIGAYVSGSDADLDRAVYLFPRMKEFLEQNQSEQVSFEEALAALRSLLLG